MYFKPESDVSRFPTLLNKFLSITGWEPWHKRIESLQYQLESNPLLEEFLVERHALELCMGYLKDYHQGTGTIPLVIEGSGQYRLYSFIAMVALVYDGLADKGKKRLAGMLQGGLKDQIGLAPLQNEIETAAHLMQRGFDVTFSDLETGGGFDFLASRGEIAIEVECKMVSGDLGRQIHRRRLLDFWKHAYPVLQEALNRTNGGCLIRIVLSSRLYGQTKFLRGICDRLAAALWNRTSLSGPDPCAVHLEDFDLSGSPFFSPSGDGLERGRIGEFVKERFGIINRHMCVLYRPSQGAIIVVVESLQKDAVLKGLLRQLKSSARDQFTLTRPGLLVVQFYDLTPDQILELARSDSADPKKASGLQIASSAFFVSPKRNHIHTLTYRSHGQVTLTRTAKDGQMATVSQEGGHTYTFKNRTHSMAFDPRYSVFT